MSELRVDSVKSKGGGAPDLPKGVTISGITTAVTLGATQIDVSNVNVSGVVTSATLSGSLLSTGTPTLGLGVTINSSGVVISGVATAGIVSATTLYGDGTNLTGVGATLAPLFYQPDPYDTGVSIDAGIGITFNQQVKAGSGNVTLSIANAGVAGTVVENFGVGSSVSISENRITINPTADIIATQDYIISYPSGAFTNNEGTDYVGTAYTFQARAYQYQLWSFGLNNHGQLGLNDTNRRSSPVQIPGTTWSKVKGGLGATYTFGAVKQDGTLWTWGRNQKGELGQNDTTSRSSPVQIPGTTWNNYSSTYCTGFATKTDGTLWAWGRGTYGELGLNSRTEYSSPVQIPGTNWNTTKLNAGSATKTDGTLWTWGFNQYGNLALGTAGPGNQKSSPTQVPGTTWVEAATVGQGGMGIKSDGTLWMWGYNGGGYRVLGQSNDTNYSSPRQVGSNTNWDKIATSNLYNFAAVYAGNTSGQLYSWGHGGFSALGQNSTSDITTGPQIIGSDTTWDIIPIGGWATQGAIKTDGTLWTWGLNGNGQSGHNNTTSYSSPKQVGSDTGYTGISASYRSMIVSKKA